MAVKLYLQSVKTPTLKYEVLSFDPVTKKAILKGRYTDFEFAPLTKESAAKSGYTLVKMET